MSLVEQHVCPPTVKWYCNADSDVVMVATTTTAYTILYLSRLDAATTAPTPTPTVLSKFFQPPPVMLEYESMSPDLPLWSVALEVLFIETSFPVSPTLALDPLPAWDSIESDSSEMMSAPRPCWIRTLIIPRGCGRHGCGLCVS